MKAGDLRASQPCPHTLYVGQGPLVLVPTVTRQLPECCLVGKWMWQNTGCLLICILPFFINKTTDF